MYGKAMNPIHIVREFVDLDLVNTFRRYGKDEFFLFNYLVNAVLSRIEEREQELILDMRYEDWIPLEIKELLDRIREYVERFFRAYGESWNGRIFKTGRELDAITEVLCYLYECGIYGDGISRYLMLKNFKNGNPHKFIRQCLEKGELEVRSRFIEIALYLTRVRQRFPDTTVFTSTPLVSRVFAFALPREVPVGIVEVNEEFLRKITLRLSNVLAVFLNVLGYKRTLSDEDRNLLYLLVKTFFEEFKEWYRRRGIDFRFYRFQVEGVMGILENAELALRNKRRNAVILEARTGAGKTEVFALSSILLILAYKLALMLVGRNCNGSPLAIVLYPRRALATDQVKRIIRYVYIYNKSLEKLAKEISLDTERLKIRISMNYAEVRRIRELLPRLREAHIGSRPIEVDLKYVKVRAYRDGKQLIVELPYVYSPDGREWLKAKIPISSLTQYKEVRESLKKLWWSGGSIDFIRAFKELVYEEPGDIHITLFESLRRDLLTSGARRLFGTRGTLGPFLFVVDEIHLNTGVHGARIALLLDRVLARVKHQIGFQRRGVLFVGLSATIPHAEEFVEKFFGLHRKFVRFVRVSESDTIPMGGEYLYIIVPATRVDALSVSIQSIIVLHFNMPAYVKNGRPWKKTLAFADNLDVVARLHHDLTDALTIGRRAQPPGEYGLQDLRNPYNPVFEITTTSDLPDDLRSLEESLKRLSGFESLRSWLEGEFWWPYSLEYIRGWRLLNTARYTGREKQEIANKHVVITDSALEVGVDYDDVVIIYQHGMPPTISALIQRAGRSGRVMKDNPLVRAAIAVMLSPYIPTQAAMLEMLLRYRSLRDLLEHERLLLATSNTAVIEQSIVEAILDHITMNSLRPNKVLYLDIEIREFERELLKYLDNKELKEYLVSVFEERLGRRDAEEHVNKVLGELKNILMRSYRSNKT